METKAFLKNLFIVLLVLPAGVMAACHPMLLSGLQLIQTDPGDTRLNNYILEHGYQWLSGNPLHRDFWSPPIFFPIAHTGAYGDILLGAAPPYWLFRLLGAAPDTSLQLWMIAAFALNFLTAWLVFRAGVGFNPLASAAGAYLFAFAGMRVLQIGHQQLVPQFFSMLAVFALCRLYQEYTAPSGHRRRWVALWLGVFSAAVVLQLFTSFYLGWFLCFGLLVFLGVALCRRETRQLFLGFVREYRLTLLVTAVCTLIPLSWFGYHYFLTYREFGPRPWWETHNQIPRLLSWLDLGKSSWLYGWTWDIFPFAGIPTENEHRIGLGLLTPVLVVMGIAGLSRSRWGKVLAVATLVIFLLALLYPGGLSPWWAVYKLVPGASGIRGVARIALLLLIPFSFGLAFCLNGVRSGVLAALLLVLVAVEQGQTTSAYDKYVVRARVDGIARLIPKDRQAFFYVNLNFARRREVDIHQLDAMWAGLASGVATVNGYHGWFPHDWGVCNYIRRKEAQSADFANVPDMLKKWTTRHSLQGLPTPIRNGDDCVYFFSQGKGLSPSP